MCNQKLPALSVIYEDEYLLFINKPVGIHSANLPTKKGNSIASLLSDKFGQNLEDDNDSGLLNRLDFYTSGILIAAKCEEVLEKLKIMQKTEQIEKEYLTLVDGHLELGQRIEGFIGSNYRRSKKVKVYEHEKSRTQFSYSEIEPIRYYDDLDLTFLRVRVRSAKRHQIRAHLSYVGHPLTGDALYGSKRLLPETINIDQQEIEFFLHAEKVRFNHPVIKDSILEFIAPMPDNLAKLIQ